MASEQHNTDSNVHPRGIWRAPYQRDGYPVIIAVDSRGRRVAEVVLCRGVTPSRVKRFLTEVLDSADPRVRLKLVTSPSPAASAPR